MMHNLNKWLDNLNQKTRFYTPYDSPSEAINIIRKIDVKSKSGWVGSFSVSSKKAKIYAINQPIFTYENIDLIGTEIAKFLLFINNPPKGFRKITADQLDKTPPPLFATPWTGEAIYLDIKSCYYHLIERLWSIKYARDLWIGLDTELSPWHVPKALGKILSEFKPIRNAIYGLLRAKLAVIWKLEKETIRFEVRKIKNPFFYPDVPLAIMDLTHAISTLAVKEFNAKYVAIDGFILPYNQAEKFKEFLENLNFTVGIKDEGLAVVKNLYSYTIGNSKTKTFNTYPEINQAKGNLFLSPENAKELLKKFKTFLLQNP